MALFTERRVGAIFLLALLALAVARFISYQVTLQNLEARDRITNNRQIISDMRGVLSRMQDAETGQRGYLLTQDPKYIGPYNSATTQSTVAMADLRQLLVNDPAEMVKFSHLQSLVDEKFGELAESLTAYHTGGIDAALKVVKTGRGKETMDQIRAVLNDMQIDQDAQFNALSEAARQSHLRGLLVFGILTLLEFVLLGFAFYLISRYAVTTREAQEALIKTNAFQLAVLQGASSAIVSTDAKGLIQSFNPAAEKMLGYRAEEVIGKETPMLWHDPADASDRANQLAKKLGKAVDCGFETFVAGAREKGWDSSECDYIRRDGTHIPVLLSVGVLRDQLGQVIGYVKIASDITAQRQGEQALRSARDTAEQANRTKSLFLANMSHELRTPLNAIIGYSEILLEDVQGGGEPSGNPASKEQNRNDLTRIHSAGKHLLGLINDVLDLSKIEAGKMALHLENFEVCSMLREVADTVKPIIKRNNNDLQMDCPAEVGTIRSDMSKLRQILFNLLSNSAKFTEKGKIDLQCRREGETIVFTVRDTGIGMTGTQLDNLFQAFTQADASTSSKYGGTGLGLAISRQFCRIMGGDISAQSEPGKGSMFRVRLPVTVVAPDVEEVALVKPAALSKPRSSRGAVLIIDDDPAARDLLSRGLQAEGYDVQSAANGDEGLQLARLKRPLAITLDVLMPSMDGWAVLSALKADSELRDIPVIMLSIIDDKAMGYALGASAFLTKPIDRIELKRVLDRYKVVGRNVLIVEDDEASRDMLMRALGNDGWNVALAENGKIALNKVTEKIPDLILLDLMMPEMDGFQFATELRRNADWKHIPIIVLTAKQLTNEDYARLNGDVQRILAKAGFSREELLGEVRGMIDQHTAATAAATATAMGTAGEKADA